MGYSCTTKAKLVMDAMMKELKEGDKINQTNTWERKGNRYFYDIGKEQHDGAITCTVMKFTSLPDGDGVGHCKRVGGIRIEPDGTITRWPTSIKQERLNAQGAGLAEYKRIYEK